MKKLEEFDSVKNLLAETRLLTRSKNTELTYLKGIKKFVEIFGIEDLDKFVEELKKDQAKANEIYKEFALKLASLELAPKTIRSWVSALKKLFSSNGIEVKKKIAMKVYTVHEDILPSKEDLRKILENSSLRTKAIITFLASSGLRASELINLKIKDINLNENPAKVYVRSLTAKERKARITFISSEARKFLEEYLNERRKKEKISEESFVFVTKTGNKLSYQNLQYMLNKVFKLIAKKEGKRYTLHPHSLRKFFKTQLISAGLPGPIVDRLVGHSRYLANEYELYTENQLREWYKRGEKALIILS
ncbi:MAG: hypothetical protein B6U78_02960 [Candidatus Aenigmarchaeota archaeon ex4484_224]|nr:MAG: hypothetical protein B6U78_02960 [Candidatus Aenigmarchaeota archaeon ex4484_224]